MENLNIKNESHIYLISMWLQLFIIFLNFSSNFPKLISISTDDFTPSSFVLPQIEKKANFQRKYFTVGRTVKLPQKPSKNVWGTVQRELPRKRQKRNRCKFNTCNGLRNRGGTI